jgi:inner membrane protein
MPTATAASVVGTRWMTHQIIGVGLAAASGAALNAPVATAAVLVGASWVGSLLPDADLAGARVHRRTRVERRVLLARAVGAVARLPLRLLTMLPHRGVTHSVLACAVASLVAGFLVSLVAPSSASTAAAGVALGYLGHIAADACTPSGVPLWAPLTRRRQWLLPAPARIPTGSLREYAVAAVLAALSVLALVQLGG